MFRFNLEPVLKHRKIVEEELQKEMSALKRRHISEQTKLLALEKSRSQCLRELQEKQARGIRARKISLYSDFIGRVTLQIEEQKKKVVSLEKIVTKKREKLIKAMKDRKMVDQLKKNRLALFEKNERRKEQKLMDEVAVMGFQKSQKGKAE